MNYDLFLFIALACAAAIALGIYVLIIQPVFSLWFQSLLSGAQIPFSKLVAMRFQKINPSVITINRIRLIKSDIISISVDDLIAHYQAQGNVSACTTAIIISRKHDIPLQWDEITALDLAGVDILEITNNARQTNDLSEIERLLEQYMDQIAAHSAHNQAQTA